MKAEAHDHTASFFLSRTPVTVSLADFSSTLSAILQPDENFCEASPEGAAVGIGGANVYSLIAVSGPGMLP